MNRNIAKWLMIILVLVNLQSCEKVEFGERPAPYVILEESFSSRKTIVSFDTIVKPADYQHLYFDGSVCPHIIAPNGIKSLEIKVNGEIDPLYETDFASDVFSYKALIDVFLNVNKDSCIITIDAVDKMDLSMSKTIRVKYKNTPF